MADPTDDDRIVQRYENRQVLLRHLTALRGRMRDLELEVAQLEEIVERLPYAGSVGGPSPPPPQRQFAFSSNALAGGVALPLAIGVMHPLDTIRTRLQAAFHGERDAAQALRSIGWRGLLRGLGPSVLWAAPQGAIRLGSYEACRGALADGPLGRSSLAVSISAVTGDLASSFIKVPRELVTQRMQTGQYSSGWSAVQSILREDGPRGLLRGYWSTCFRDAPFMVLLFFSYEHFKAWKIRLTFADAGPSQVLSPWSDAETILWGGVSGAFAGLLTTPFDVTKTRIMTATSRVGILETVRAIGPYGLFAGSGPRSAWWFCVSSIFFGTFERLRIVVHDARQGRDVLVGSGCRGP